MEDNLYSFLYVWLINYRFNLLRSSVSSFSSQYLLLFLKSLRSCVLLPTFFTSFICPSIESWSRQFLLRIWPIQLTFLGRILFRSVLFSPIYSRTSSLITFTYHSSSFSSSTTFQISPNTSVPIFFLSSSLSHIKQYFVARKIWKFA